MSYDDLEEARRRMDSEEDQMYCCGCVSILILAFVLWCLAVYVTFIR
jgi:hypothetical protein